MADVAETAIKEVEQEFQVKVVAVVTDNASNMKAMRGKMDDKLFTFGCQSHILNLLCGDIGANHTMITEKVVTILKVC